MNDEHQFGFKPTIQDEPVMDEDKLSFQRKIYICLTPLAVILVLSVVTIIVFGIGALIGRLF